MGSVAALLAMDGTTLTASLKPLERRWLVEVVVGAIDNRRRLLALTIDGGGLLTRAVPILGAHACGCRSPACAA